MRDQSSPYNQQLSRYDILRFGNISLFFGPKNGTSTELQTLDIFLEIKKTLMRVCFAQIWEKKSLKFI